jgi:uncharacterized membrane protein
MAALKTTAWGLMAFLSVGVAGYALFHVFTGFAFLPLENPMLSPWGLRAHITGSAFAMLTGAFQFYGPLRRKFPRIHRWTGRVYVAACVFGGIAGGMIALTSTAGPIAGWGFFLLAVLWLISTLSGWAAALRRDFKAHEVWMMRSFALTFAAVTLRLYLPIGPMFTGGEFLPAYRIIAWAAWVPNLLIVEAWLRFSRHPGLHPGSRKAAA